MDYSILQRGYKDVRRVVEGEQVRHKLTEFEYVLIRPFDRRKIMDTRELKSQSTRIIYVVTILDGFYRVYYVQNFESNLRCG